MTNIKQSAHQRSETVVEQTTVFKPYSLMQLLKGIHLYSLDMFYKGKNILFRYDEKTDYVNFGYWPNGAKTKNPSTALVMLVAEKLNLQPDDILLNIGSGLGQPDIDILKAHPVKRIIGINICAEQVHYAKNKFKSLKLDHIIDHRISSAADILEVIQDVEITSIISVEAFGEIPAIEDLIEKCSQILLHGGPIIFCDIIIRQNVKQNVLKRTFTTLVYKILSKPMMDHWREEKQYTESLEKSGFTNIRCQHIGPQVFPCLFEHVKEHLPMLKQNGFSLPSRFLFWLHFFCLEMLYNRGLLDYTVIHAEKAQPKG